jgi:hypothetical protein
MNWPEVKLFSLINPDVMTAICTLLVEHHINQRRHAQLRSFIGSQAVCYDKNAKMELNRMKKLNTHCLKAATGFLFFVATFCLSAPSAHANYGPQLFELAHTPVADIDGSTEFIPRKGGGYDYLQYTPTQIGDAITFSITIKHPGTYRMQVTTYKDGKEGIYSIAVDGQEIGQKDFYESNVWNVGTFPVKPGVFRITFRCVGQNASSGGNGLKLGTLYFR